MKGLWVILIVILYLEKVCPFNVDLRYPIIFQNVAREKGAKNHFGASVAILNADQGPSSIIIGAPKANSTFAMERDIFEPGVVWKCSVGPQLERCVALNLDPRRGDDESLREERKDEGWLAGPGAMALNSKSFVACASRWEKWNTTAGVRFGNTVVEYSAFMHGVCYQRSRMDLFKDPMPPVPNPSNARLTPLNEPRFERQSAKNGQAGFSVHLPKSGNEILIGAPGLEKWRGSVIQYLSRDEGATFSKSYIYPSSEPRSLETYNYFGYSLTSGRFFGADLEYCGSAPRGNKLRGKVIVFRIPSQFSGDEPILISTELEGEQTGAYFGASLLALDVNGDGFDDLLVGAPRHSRNFRLDRFKDQRPLKGRASARLSYERFGGYGDEGSVFIYYSDGVTFHRQEKVLNGGNRPWTQYGTAMTSLGDLNRDGFNDFAVSAPYEPNPASGATGAVYIYLGTGIGQITTHSQVILASKLDSGLRGFGLSLASNEDVDNNGFNDIVIGSFNSSETVLLRSRPLISVYGRLSSSQKKLALDIEAFQVESCVSFKGDYVPSQVQLGVRVRADSQFRPARVQLRFSSEDVEGSSIVAYNVSVPQSNEVCRTFIVRVISALETSSAPVVFHQTIFIPEESGFGWGVARKRVIQINSDGSTSVSGEAFSSFCASCPLIDPAKPSDTELQLPLAVLCGDDDICEADLRLRVSFRDLPETGFVLGSAKTVIMDIFLSNHEETAIAPAVLISWTKLKLRRNPPDCSSVEGVRGNLITYRCTLGKLLEENRSSSVAIEFDVSTLILRESTESELLFNVTAQTASEMLHPVSETIVLPLSASADPFIEGSKWLEPFNMDTPSPFLVFKHNFEVKLEGPTTLSQLQILFDVPVNLTTSSGTVVNVRGVNVDQSPGQMTCQATKGNFAKSELVVITSPEQDSDPNFDAAGIGGFLPRDEDISKESNSTLVERDTLLIHCDSPFVSCMEVTCRTAVFSPATTSLVSFILDIESETIRSLLKTYKVSQIQVESRGRLVLTDLVKAIQPVDDKSDEATSITLIKREGYKPVSKWLYILAVVIGFLILACVVFCLYACGCFEREKNMAEPVNGTDEVDGAVVDEEEMVPLREKSRVEEDLSDERNDNVSPLVKGLMMEKSPSIDVTDPPDFVPKDPPIPEEPELEEMENQDEGGDGGGRGSKAFERR